MLTRIRRSLKARLRSVAWRLLEGHVRAEIEPIVTDVDARIADPPRIESDILGSARIAARAIPRPRAGALLEVPISSDRNEGDELPVPPVELQAVHADYLESGECHAASLRALCARNGLEVTGNLRILDFGCGTGRILRHLVDVAQAGEAWGADLSSERIDWCRANLTPPFHFLTSSTAPHLPFEDNYFDLVYGASVFTHIADLDDTWLMELRRIARPGALLYLTVMDRNIIDTVLAEDSPTPYKDWFASGLTGGPDLDAAFRVGADGLGTASGMFAVGRGGGIDNVFYDLGHLRRMWGSVLEILEIVPETSYHQTAVILRKA